MKKLTSKTVFRVLPVILTVSLIANIVCIIMIRKHIKSDDEAFRAVTASAADSLREYLGGDDQYSYYYAVSDLRSVYYYTAERQTENQAEYMRLLHMLWFEFSVREAPPEDAVAKVISALELTLEAPSRHEEIFSLLNEAVSLQQNSQI
ncbi:MAG: hypothetical protein LBK23_01125 [Oscillospiraceae bacterium]|jgi:hypothetical protein|nr:hypothetical protein [Oscillospiraceae bacterium]